MDILKNNLCMRFWRVPFVFLVFIFFIFVSGSWAQCICEPHGYNFNPSTTFPTTIEGQCIADSDNRCTVKGSSWYGWNLSSCKNIVNGDCGCTLDSIQCNKKGEGYEWNSDNCTCDSIAEPDTTYRCQNGFIGSATAGMRPIATLYRCVSTGSSSDQCVQTGSLNGTCSDWGFCSEGVDGCDISPDGGGGGDDGGSGCKGSDCGCNRSGGSYTTSKRCYYSCLDGSSRSCAPTGTEYVAGNIYVGTCPPHPPAGCSGSSSSNNSGSSSSNNGGSSSSESSSSSSDDSSSSFDDLSSGSSGDYRTVLDSIRNMLHTANIQRERISSWDLDFLKPAVDHLVNIDDYTLNEWQKTLDIDIKMRTYQDSGWNLTSDIRNDLDSAHLLLDEINEFLAYDSIRTYSSDTTYNPLLRDIKTAIDSSGSSGTDSVYNLLKPYFSDSGQYDSPVTRFLNTISANLGRDSSDADYCSRYYACLREGRRPCVGDFPGAAVKCMDGGTPIDGIVNTEMGILETIWDAIWGDDSTALPVPSDDSDTNVTFPGYSSAMDAISSASDSLGSFDVRSIVDSVKLSLDSARRMSQDTTRINPDSLWLDSAEIAPYVSHIMLPGGTGQDCFVCSAELGTFGGLSDTSLSIYIDFGNFGGYNWCEIIRAVVRIATLVTCISLTLGSWAAAFGYNPKNDA